MSEDKVYQDTLDEALVAFERYRRTIAPRGTSMRSQREMFYLGFLYARGMADEAERSRGPRNDEAGHHETSL